MRLIVTGSWSFRNYELFYQKMEQLTFTLREVTILSAHQEGVERMAEWWAFKNWWPREVYHPDYKKHGDRAERKRNDKMVRSADALIVFKIKSNPHVKDLIRRATNRELKVRIIDVGFRGNLYETGMIQVRPLGGT